MHRLLTVIRVAVLVGLFTGNASSQSFAKIDSATYAQYLAGDWQALRSDGKEAIRRGMDYYYLRMRLGIAHYELKNYRSAEAHFKKALEFSRDDPVAGEYLYYCYLYSGQAARAEIYRDGFTGKLAEKLPPETIKFIRAASAEYLYSRTLNDQYIDAAEETFGAYTSGYQSLTRYYHNASLLLSHTLKPGITFTHSYTRLSKSSFMYLHDGATVTVADGLKAGQNQYYLSPSITTPSGFTISPSVHVLGIGYQVITSGGNGFGPGSAVGLATQKTNAIVGGLAIGQSAGPLDISLGGNYSNLNGEDQILVRGGLTWYPKGNLDLYLGGCLNAQTRMNELSTTTHLIPQYLFGAGIASKLWIEVFGAHGDMLNYVEGNGYIVYNGLDRMKHKAGVILVCPFTKKGSKIYLGARWIQYQSTFTPFTPVDGALINPLYYDNYSVFGGISLRL